MKKSSIKHLLLSLLMFICWIAIIISAAAYTFLTTTWGAKMAATYLIEAYIPFCNITIGSYEGTIEKGLLLKDVTISQIPHVKDVVIHIQDLSIQVPLMHWDQVALKIINAKADLGSADPIVFNGTIIQNKIKGNCYSRAIDAKQVVAALGYDELAKVIYGSISHVDFEVAGTVAQPRLMGHFFIDKFVFKNMTQISDGFGHLDITFVSLGEVASLKGFIILESAAVKVDKVNIDLTTSQVKFDGDVSNLLLDIHGSAKVEDVNIDIAIKDTLKKPRLLFSSDPPLSENEILMLLAFNKSWSGIDDGQGVGLRKKLTDTFNVGMAVEERQSQVGRDLTPGYSRTLEGQMRLSDKFSLNVAKKYLPTNEASSSSIGSSQQAKDNESQIYLQYKQRF